MILVFVNDNVLLCCRMSSMHICSRPTSVVVAILQTSSSSAFPLFGAGASSFNFPCSPALCFFYLGTVRLLFSPSYILV